MKKTILFDLDGTLTDSGEGIINCSILALKHFGCPIPSREQMRVFVGPPLHESFIKHGVPADKADEAVKIFRSRIVKLALAASAIGLLGFEILVAPMRVIMPLLARALFIVSVYAVTTEKTCSVVEKIDRSSFGIYLFHSPLIYITFANIPNAHPAVVVFINLVVFGAVAYGLTSLVQKTKFRLLIGE